MTMNIVIFALFATVCWAQELHVKHAPTYVVFQGQAANTPVASSELHDVLAAPLGLSQKKWPAIQSKSVLKRPKANVVFTVVTNEASKLPIEGKARIPLHWDLPFVDMEQLMNNVQRKFLDQEPLMLDLSSTNEFYDVRTSSPLFQSLPSSLASVRDRMLEGDSIFNKALSPVTVSALNTSLTPDGGMLAELQMMEDVVAKLKQGGEHKKSKTPDLVSFTLMGLKSVGDKHGAESEQAKEAEKILTKHIDQLTEELKSIYKDNVMVQVITVPSMDKAKVRKTRSLMEVVANDKFPNLNLEINYYPDFPVTFNIVLWLMVILSITVLFVAYGIWNMNPNLESILYRVPQDDLKKNN